MESKQRIQILTNEKYKRGEKDKREKDKFKEYIELDMQNVVASAKEELELERKLVKKLKVKGGKEGKTPSAEEFPDSSPKRKKRKKKSLDQGLESEAAGDSGLGVSESLETCDAYISGEIPAKSPSRMKCASRPAVSCVAEAVLEEAPAKVPAGKRDGKYISHLRVRSGDKSEEYTKIRRHIRSMKFCAFMFNVLFMALHVVPNSYLISKFLIFNLFQVF
ncbi:hypothetical protein CJ030_MR7G001972 [Morella rubra]|uniref:Uncharacterized protein n=1 Tax=Morella rubra TaxID=262757 RepID=A0A6A1WSU1_9ROSI|nr:hypothetical protein CJ030_MR7G001971 [Morella rubra]KAB1228245.1 hypothetical protein CJ030_MR7G001972 [Morella rubra]